MEKVEKNGNELKQRNTSNGIGPTIANQLRTHTKKNARARTREMNKYDKRVCEWVKRYK